MSWELFMCSYTGCACIYMYVFFHVFTHIDMYKYIYIYIYTYTHVYMDVCLFHVFFRLELLLKSKLRVLGGRGGKSLGHSWR